MRADLWKVQILEALAAVANLEGQRASIGGGAFFSCPTELLCQLWDDTGLTEFFERGAVFTSALDAAFMELNELHGQIDLKVSLSSLLAHPQWQQAALLATKIADMLRDTPVLPNPKFYLE
jgi:hypothetical protein